MNFLDKFFPGTKLAGRPMWDEATQTIKIVSNGVDKTIAYKETVDQQVSTLQAAIEAVPVNVGKDEYTIGFTEDCDVTLDNTIEDAVPQDIVFEGILPARAKLVNLYLIALEDVTRGEGLTDITALLTLSVSGEISTVGSVISEGDANIIDDTVLPSANAQDLTITFTPDADWTTVEAGNWKLVIYYTI